MLTYTYSTWVHADPGVIWSVILDRRRFMIRVEHRKRKSRPAESTSVRCPAFTGVNSCVMASPSVERRNKNIVVTGAGYGGITTALRAARLFRRRPGVQVHLVDRNPYHLLKTRLHEAGCASGGGSHSHRTAYRQAERDDPLLRASIQAFRREHAGLATRPSFHKV
jgi:hypothetical protein